MTVAGATGQAAVTLPRSGWHFRRWIWLRRIVQLSILGLFLLGPLAGIGWVKGNLNASLILDTVPLTDPYVLLQTWLAGHELQATAVIGAALVLLFYVLVGGRSYCAWVCPINMVTDAANGLRRRWGVRSAARFSARTRYAWLTVSLLLALFTGQLAWELINPVSMLHRGLIFGMGLAWLVVVAIFLLDLFVSQRAWCGHLCPVGAFYSLIGKVSVLRVSAARRAACNDCMDCYAVCPEPQIIRPALKGLQAKQSALILAANCTHCARCIDVCDRDVFSFTTRFDTAIRDLPMSAKASGKTEVMS